MFRSFLNILIISLVSFYSLNVYGKDEYNKRFTVVIDAGHGGKDIGATDNGVKEKDINLKVAKNLESLIKKKLKNTNVVMTRDNDTYLTLQERADKANKSQGDIFISIHTNSVDKRNRNRKNIAGSSVYTLGLHKDDNNLEVARRENSVIELEQDYEQRYSGFDPQRDESYIIFEMAQKKNLSQSILFAEDIEKELVKSGRQDRGVHQAGFWVLWATSMPSVLVELDFICNPESAKYISSDKGAKELAEAIFKAVQKYESSWRKTLFPKNRDNSEIYSDNEESSLEDSFTVLNETPVATAKVRQHKIKERSNNLSKRKRRSNSSKEKSNEKDYENKLLAWNIQSGNNGVTSQNEVKEISTPLLAINKDEGKKQKEKKNKEAKKSKEDKKKPKKDKNKDNSDSHKAKVNKLVTVYKIQILASADLLNQSNERFCGLSPITTFKENNLYKYYYGESTDKAELEAVLSDVRKKIPDAFIVSSQKTIQPNN